MVKILSKVKNDEENDLQDIFGSKEVFVKTTTINCFHHRIFLDEDIKDASFYRKAIDIIDNAGPNDFINIHIDTPGGDLSSAISIINAIRGSDAQILGTLEQKAFSAGSLILLACPNIMIKPYATLMAHSGMAGAWGAFDRATDQLGFFKEETTRLMREIYTGFFTEEEIESVVRGHREIWLKDHEILSRLENLQKYRLEIQEVAEALEEAEIERMVLESLKENGEEVVKKRKPASKRAKKVV